MESRQASPKKLSSEPLAAAIGRAAMLRPVLVADAQTLDDYGPVLRRMLVGLIDEVGDLTLLSLGESPVTDYVPCPPVRIVTETHQRRPLYDATDFTARQFSIHRVGWRWWDSLFRQQRVLRLSEVLRPCKPTLIHALSEREIPLVRRLSKILRIPYAVTHLGLRDVPTGISTRRCGALICCNSAAARAARRLRRTMSGGIHLIPIGTQILNEPACFQHEHAAVHLAYFGPLREGLGLASLVNVLKRLTDRENPCHLTLIGEGPAQRDLWRQGRQLHISDRLHLLPPVDAFLHDHDAYKTVLQAVDVLVQPWPLRRWAPHILEAMSVGTAVVAAEGGGHDLLRPDCARLTPFGDEPALFKAVAGLLDDRAAARAMAAAAQAFLRKHCRVSQMASHLGRAYYETVKVAPAAEKWLADMLDAHRQQPNQAGA